MPSYQAVTICAGVGAGENQRRDRGDEGEDDRVEIGIGDVALGVPHAGACEPSQHGLDTQHLGQHAIRPQMAPGLLTCKPLIKLDNPLLHQFVRSKSRKILLPSSPRFRSLKTCTRL